jgi:hypothetical protein
MDWMLRPVTTTSKLNKCVANGLHFLNFRSDEDRQLVREAIFHDPALGRPPSRNASACESIDGDHQHQGVVIVLRSEHRGARGPVNPSGEPFGLALLPGSERRLRYSFAVFSAGL